MSRIRIASHAYDVSHPFRDEREFADHLVGLISASLEQGARIVVFPEYACQALARLPGFDLARISAFAWKELFPRVLELSRAHQAIICAGSSPYEREPAVDRSGGPARFTNRALLAVAGREVVAEKRCLTPWETDFAEGGEPEVFEWDGLRVACLICFDSEFPEIAARLKRRDPHIVLYPSATADELGVARVTRCASARAVELGAVTVVSPLVGTEMSNPLVDINMGRCAVYFPAQEAFRGVQPAESALISSGFESLAVEIDRASLLKVKERDAETKPFSRYL
jgi:predicted amidohydrolase